MRSAPYVRRCMVMASGGVTGDDGDEPVDAGLPNRTGDVRSVDEDAALLLDLDGAGAGELAEGRAVAEREAAGEREPGQRAVHRPGVEVAKAEPLGQELR